MDSLDIITPVEETAQLLIELLSGIVDSYQYEKETASETERKINHTKHIVWEETRITKNIDVMGFIPVWPISCP
ncbi:hypothetical protein JTB14_019253 [Gonioctena quinquepunctata]|nr:hypothetical protein JTB14_019253 [Gonioctena quinquepunctata]